MSLPPQLSPRLVVGLTALLSLMVARVAMQRLWPMCPSTPTLALALGRQIGRDVRRGGHRRHWMGLGLVGGVHVVLHYWWLANAMYTRVPWLDVVSHLGGGATVAGILVLGLREVVPGDVQRWWLVLLVLAIGSGFELYEFAIKRFWYTWTVQVYLHDTLLDLVVDVLGAGLVTSLGVRVRLPVRQRDAH